MRAIRTGLAGHAAVNTNVVLAGKARNTVVGVIAARIDAQTAADALVARVRRVAAIIVDLTRASTCDETPREIIAACEKTDFPDGARTVGVAKRIQVRARRAERARVTPRAAPIDTATVATVGTATVSSPVGRDARVGTGVIDRSVDPAVWIDASVASWERGGSGFTTAGRSCSGQQNVSKETHRKQSSPATNSRSAGRFTVRSIAPLALRCIPAVPRA